MFENIVNAMTKAKMKAQSIVAAFVTVLVVTIVLVVMIVTSLFGAGLLTQFYTYMNESAPSTLLNTTYATLSSVFSLLVNMEGILVLAAIFSLVVTILLGILVVFGVGRGSRAG